jgi:gamma-glutamyltranspeptidase
MDDFSTPGKANGFGLAPAESNYIEPGKRPLSSMSPTMMFRRSDAQPNGSFGKLVLVLGASGGPKIITAVLHVILNHIFLGMPLFEATIQARVHEQLLYHGTSVTTVEKSALMTGEPILVKDRTLSALKSRNHSLLEIDYTGTVQSISVDLETNTLR